MKLDAKNGDRGMLYDADGVKVPPFCTADTETGVVVYPVMENGQIVRQGGRVKKLCRRFKTPMKWVPLGEKGLPSLPHESP